MEQHGAVLAGSAEFLITVLPEEPYYTSILMERCPSDLDMLNLTKMKRDIRAP